VADGFEAIVDRIYQATAEPEQWPTVLHDIGQTVTAPTLLLITVRRDQWVGWTRSIDTPATVDEYLRSNGPTYSQSTPRLIQANCSGFVSERDLFTDEEFLSDPMMTEWGTYAGLHHAAATAIHIPTGDSILVHAQRRVGMPPFGPSDIAGLDKFRPHLARAGLLAVRWRMERMRAAAEALALVGLPAAVLDSRGRVLLANRLIQEMASWIAWLPGDRLALVEPAANELLRQALGELGDPVALAVRSIAIKATQTTDAAVVHIVPTTGFARDLFGGAFGILVITPVSSSSGSATAILQALFDLTPSEARVASAITEGLSLDQIASRHAVSIETVRAQTKAVFAKTGTNRQAQLAALLAGHPKIPIR
jgi:DNA-binding CsgD family transcriptional regulator